MSFNIDCNESFLSELWDLRESNKISKGLFIHVLMSLRTKQFDSHELERRLTEITGDIHKVLDVLLLEDKYEFLKHIHPSAISEFFNSEYEMYAFINKHGLSNSSFWSYKELVRVISCELLLPESIVRELLDCEIAYMLELKNFS